MSDFYQIKLSQYGGDNGSANGRALTERDLKIIAKKKAAGLHAVAQAYRDGITGDGNFDVAKGLIEVIFEASPIVSESRSADYVNQPLPGPAGMVIYKLTGNRIFTINAKFVPRHNNNDK